MKVIKSNEISAFGGINFVFDFLNKQNINKLLKNNLPQINPNSLYSWKDLFYSFLAIYFCGGDCMEDLHTNLRTHFKNNPFVKIPSPDTVLRRMSSLATNKETCFTKRGVIEHEFSTNNCLFNLNIEILNELGVFKSKELVFDYDNTIIFNEKIDSKMTYKRDYGYQPGVCTLNEKFILYIENRNGNSDAKSFQADTLNRIFESIKSHKSKKVCHFRADAASYQYDVINLLEKEVDYFYIGCRNSYIEKYFSQIQNWVTTSNQFGELEIGSIMIRPFCNQAIKNNKKPLTYRLVVKRTPSKDGQINLITQDAFEYRAILTNNFEMNNIEIANFYAKRGNMERQFDILKNDFGWQKLPFSSLNKNLVFLYLSAICRNLYNNIIEYFSAKHKNLKPIYRIKKFIFRFIILPAKWIKQSRQLKLKVYNPSFEYW